MRVLIGLAALSVGSAASAAEPAQEPAPSTFNLTCAGRGVYVVPNLERDENGRYKDDKRVETEGRARVKVTGAAVAVRLPGTMPGGDTWRELTNVQIDADRISGKFRLGFFPASVRIDRRTGDIDITGGARFDGNCEKAPDENAAPKF
jgi:hypothetical protein